MNCRHFVLTWAVLVLVATAAWANDTPKWSDHFARQTFAAWRAGKPMPQLSATHPQASLADGYAVQDQFIELLREHDAIGGFKAAAVTPQGQQHLGLEGPLVAVVPASGVHCFLDNRPPRPASTATGEGSLNAPEVAASGSPRYVIDLARDPARMLETEIGYVFDRAVTNPLADTTQLQQAVASIVAVLEVPGGPVDDSQPVTAADLVARNINAKEVVLGKPHDCHDVDPDAVAIQLFHDGKCIQQARGEQAAGGQWSTLLKTVNQLIRRGLTIQPGQFVTNGALGKIVPACSGHFRADFGPLGSVAIEVVDSRSRSALRPNIILIMADDLGYGHLGSYGQEKIKTPHLDQLAAEGIRFTSAYAGAPLCAAARSVLMTGLHAGHTPVRGNSGGIPLRDSDITLAEVMRQADYQTGLFGKWGLGDVGTTGTPGCQGFDQYFGYLHQKHAHFYYTDYLWQNGRKYPLPGNADGRRTEYSHDVILEKSLDFIGQDRDRPFFCFLSLTIPHHEWTVPEESLRLYQGQFQEDRPQFRWREGYAFPRAPKANMAAMITHMDQGVGRVIKLLQERGLTDKTLVIFTSDNGPDRYSLACADFFNARGGLRGYKYDLYEGGIRVPAIASWPGKIPAHATSDYPWYFADLLPTFAQFAGASGSVPTPMDGISLTATLLGQQGTMPPRRLLYWRNGESRAARWGQWKAVWPAPVGPVELNAPVELYDLVADRAEQHDLAQEHPELAAWFARRLAQSDRGPPPQLEPVAPDGRYYQ